MSGPDEGFLSRWSRRKRAGEEAAPHAANEEQREAAAEEAQSARPSESTEAEPQSEKSAEPEFDISKLPPIESITAETDIRVFLAPGVPPALTQAALRRAWVADPKIRDFIEMAENQWDFNASGVPGFDLSAPTGDIKRMLADIMGPDPADESAAANSPIAEADEKTDRAALASSTNLESGNREIAMQDVREAAASVATPAAEADSENEAAKRTLLARQEEWQHAPQQNDAMQNSERPITRRTHGSAMPR